VSPVPLLSDVVALIRSALWSFEKQRCWQKVRGNRGQWLPGETGGQLLSLVWWQLEGGNSDTGTRTASVRSAPTSQMLHSCSTPSPPERPRHGPCPTVAPCPHTTAVQPCLCYDITADGTVSSNGLQRGRLPWSSAQASSPPRTPPNPVPGAWAGPRHGKIQTPGTPGRFLLETTTTP